MKINDHIIKLFALINHLRRNKFYHFIVNIDKCINNTLSNFLAEFLIFE